ncbi:MAG: hypothetical protein NWE87_04430 [Candidatus Bathyarchaeota archaeon]|nr:hypothetical protein [Candidatus Bathyarchaeota archaeon]
MPASMKSCSYQFTAAMCCGVLVPLIVYLLGKGTTPTRGKDAIASPDIAKAPLVL